MRLLPSALVFALLCGAAGPAAAQDGVRGEGARQDRAVLPGRLLSDRELAEMTGKFLLPGGAEVALSITSDTVLNGQTVLRTVLNVDGGPRLTVFGRREETGALRPASSGSQSAGGAMAPSGIAVSLDRHSGIQTLTPIYGVATQSNVSLAGAPDDAAALGLAPVAVTPGGPAVATLDGQIALQALRNGSQVTFSGDQIQASHLVGQSIATALINSGNDRAIDTVTNVAIDLRNVEPYQIGAAAMRADMMALEATRGMIR